MPHYRLLTEVSKPWLCTLKVKFNLPPLVGWMKWLTSSDWNMSEVVSLTLEVGYENAVAFVLDTLFEFS